MRKTLVVLLLLVLLPGLSWAASASLSWSPPTQNNDGSPLIDLAGYRIHYGTAAGSLTRTVDTGLVTSSVVSISDAEAAGATWFFSVSALNSQGAQSDPSLTVSKSFSAAVTNYTVTTSVNLSESGTVTGAGIYASGALATFTASSAPGYHFSYWSGGVSGRANPVSLAVNANQTVTANFVRLSYAVEAQSAPVTGGMVSGAGEYLAGAVAALVPVPASGFRFAGWEGDAAGSANPLLLTVDRALVVTARFEPSHSYVVAAWAVPTGAGSVSGGGLYPSGSKAILSATPAAGYRFAGWSGNARGSGNPLVIRVNRDKSLTANFESTAKVSVPAALPAGGARMLEEDWGSGSVNRLRWSAFGSPAAAVEVADNPGGWALATGGDLASASGLTSVSLFPVADASLTFEAQAGVANASLTVGFATGGSTSPEIGVELTADGGGASSARYFLAGEEFVEQTDGLWHRYRVHVLSDGRVDFYRDGVQVTLSNLAVDLASGASRALALGGFGARGAVRLGALALVNPPPAPVIATNGGEAFSTTLERVPLAGSVSAADDLLLNDEPVAGYLAGSPAWAFTLRLDVGENLVSLTAKDIWGNESEQATTVITLEEGAQPSAPSGGAGGCFIATAAFGSYEAPSVKMLRSFRDEVLMATAPGRWFVSGYYAVSPPIADRIATSETARAAVRLLLLPLIALAWLTLNPLPAVTLLLAGAGAFLARSRRGGRSRRAV